MDVRHAGTVGGAMMGLGVLPGPKVPGTSINTNNMGLPGGYTPNGLPGLYPGGYPGAGGPSYG